MRKSKAKTVDLLYINPKENKKTPKKQKAKITSKKKNSKENSNRINLSNEIIIGLTPRKEEKAKKDIKKKLNKKIPKKRIEKAKTNKKIDINKNKEKNVKNNIKKIKTQKIQKIKKIEDPRIKKIKLQIFKWTSITILIILVLVIFMLSSVFNTKQITVTNNSKLSIDEIISLSGIKTDENMFRINTGKVKNNLKSNLYVEDVKITRNLNGTVNLEIKERIATYMLKFANAYMYINNQGYMIELSENPIEVPMLNGFITPIDVIKEGNRLAVEDLKKLETVLNIMENAKNKGFASLITEINISNEFDYIIILQSELKTVHFGDSSNINEKMRYVQKILEEEKGIEGEIFVTDPNNKKIYFREKV